MFCGTISLDGISIENGKSIFLLPILLFGILKVIFLSSLVETRMPSKLNSLLPPLPFIP